MTDAPLRIAAFATHPIQYHAPWFRALVAQGAALKVFFGLLPDARQQAVGFGGEFQWDSAVLGGYDWEALPQRAAAPELGRFGGLRSGGIGRALHEFGPDVVLLTGWNALPLVQALRTATQLGIPTVVRGESNALRVRSVWKRSGHRILLSAYDAFVAIGKANRTFLESNGVPPERIFDGGYFVDEDHFLSLAKTESQRRDESRRRWGIPDGACCFLFAGKLQPKKRPFDFIRAFGLVASRAPAGAIHALVVGSGELERELRVEARPLGGLVTFAGFLNQTEIGGAYASADALVLPSDQGETWGLVVNEAMLFGLPAIVSDRVGCGPDLVIEGETGFVFPCGDVDGLANRMTTLARDQGLRSRMGRSARTRVLGYSPARGAAATIAAARMAAGIG